MKKTYLIFFLLYSGALFAQAPGNVRDFSIWMKGDFKKNSRTTNNSVATAIPGKVYPATGLLNYNEVLQFEGLNKQVFVPVSLDALSQATVFVVYQNDNPGVEQTVWKLGSSSGTIQLTTGKVRDDEGKTVSYDVARPALPVINTYVKRWKKEIIEDHDEEGLFLGSGGDAEVSFRGKIAEYVVYRRVLKMTEQRKIESSLALKYGISLTNDYISSSARVIWSNKKNKAFCNRIIGIGRDDKADLYQRQSCFRDQSLFIAISAGRIAPSNTENKTVIEDDNFLLLGDNDGELRFDSSKESTSHIPVLKRQWLMQVEGRSATSMSTELRLDVDKLFPERYPAESYLLLIDRSGEGNFTSDNIEYVTANEISDDGIITFSPLSWDTDHSGKDIFTFSINPIPASSITTSSRQIDDQIEEQVSLYPNPSHDGHFKLDISLEKPTAIQVQIYDASNRLIKTMFRQQQQHYQIRDKINGSSGIYTFLVKSRYKSTVRRLVIR